MLGETNHYVLRPSTKIEQINTPNRWCSKATLHLHGEKKALLKE